MKIAGFSFVRNAVKYDYPIVEAITSVLPICNEFVIAVGLSEDSTLELIKSINSNKIRIIETIWDDSLREGGQVLAKETDKALRAISPDADWAFYIQGDEVVHEKYLDEIKNSMLKWKDDKNVDGLLFNYRHFYGSYDYVADAPNWYRKEIRVIRPSLEIFSYKDAQGFRKSDNKVLNVKQISAYIYHYGWVKKPEIMQKKQENFHKLWHDDNWVKKNIPKRDEFDYSTINSLTAFTESHPEVMKPRIVKSNWKFDFDLSYKNYSSKDRFKLFVEKKTGYRIGEYKNYRII
ncbi:MAG: glycosyltransferase family 2 protein [Bacteroidetes bacterium]|nr:glycosyltransferase family 2 protein [Bacteroidota bacterium]